MSNFEIDKFPVLALKNVIIFPKSITPVIIGRPTSIKAVEKALMNNDLKGIYVLCQKNGDEDNINIANLNPIGTYSNILQVVKMPKGNLKVLIEGQKRISVEEFEEHENIIYAKGKEINTISHSSDIEREALWRNFIKLYNNYLKYNSKLPEIAAISTFSIEDLEIATDSIIPHLFLKTTDKQRLLEESNLENRIRIIIIHLMNEIEISETEERIRNNIQNQIETSQKEYYLKEQLKAIQKELKNQNIEEDIVSKYKNTAKNLDLPEEVYEKIEKEALKLEQMQELSAEAAVGRNYIDWILSIPWKKQSEDNLSIEEAEKILNYNHFGLNKVKERILELIAAKKYCKNKLRSPILCLVGPPGVGKTSLGKSIADSLSKEFVRVALGGIKDEADIKGHRKTYIGSMPGKIIQGMKRVKTINPIFLLDEIDKMASDIHGDPASALLEVLDPEQNKHFIDSFLDLPYDLSNVMFIATANSIESIPYPLLDRMEIIYVSGYTKDEKLNIAQLFLIPKQIKEHSISNELFEIKEEAINLLIIEYTKEAGVRQLERLIIRLIRKTIGKILENKNNSLKKQDKIIINTKTIREYFKTAPFKMHENIHSSKIGIVTGLAWTELGGDILEIEVALTPGKGSVTLTGQLGEVMQESAQAALTYLRTRMKEFGISKSKFTQYDIHIHVPEGATPKDGPSAGIAMCTALVSRFCNIPVKSKIAMTGEITLQGRVLAIGGLKEKLLAAHMYGFNTVIVPKESQESCQETLDELGKLPISIVYVKTMDEVMKNALIYDKIRARSENKKNKTNAFEQGKEK
jgi:ATP-dependent Lon protease